MRGFAGSLVLAVACGVTWLLWPASVRDPLVAAPAPSKPEEFAGPRVAVLADAAGEGGSLRTAVDPDGSSMASHEVELRRIQGQVFDGVARERPMQGPSTALRLCVPIGVDNGELRTVCEIGCDGLGRFDSELDLSLFPDAEVWLVPTAEGYESFERCIVEWDGRGDGDAPVELVGLELVLEAIHTVAGVVVDESTGEAVEGARVELVSLSPIAERAPRRRGPRVWFRVERELSVETDAQGRFQSLQPARARWNLRAWKSGHGRGSVSVADGVAAPVVIPLDGKALGVKSLRGVVVGPRGLPVEGAYLRVFDGRLRSAVTNGEGEFELWDLVAQETRSPVVVVVTAVGHADELAPAWVAVERSALDRPVEIRLPKGRQISGRLRHADGTALATGKRYWVSLLGPPLEGFAKSEAMTFGGWPSLVSVAGGDRVLCDADGKFVFERVPPNHGGETYTVRYGADGKRSSIGAAWASAWAGQLDVDLVLGESHGAAESSMDMVVTDAVTLEPVASAEVSMLCAAAGRQFELSRSRTNAAGRAHVSAVFPAAAAGSRAAEMVGFVVRAHGYVLLRENSKLMARIFPDARLDGVVRRVLLYPERQLTVRVREQSGEPARRVKVRCVSALVGLGEERSMWTDEKGDVQISGLPAAEVRVNATRSGYPESETSRTIDLRANREHVLEIGLPPPL